MPGWAFAGCGVREEERQILGWCVEQAEVPACVAAVPVDAWSPDAEFLVRLLIELAGVDVAVGPLDLWSLAVQPVKGEIRAMLAVWFAPDDLLLLPQYAPWNVVEVEAACAMVADRHAARVAYQVALRAAEERRESRRGEAMARGCDALRAPWEAKGTPAVPLGAHPGWLPYLKADLREAA